MGVGVRVRVLVFNHVFVFGCVCVCVRGRRGCCLCGHGWMVCSCVGDKGMHWWFLGCGCLGVCGCGWLDGRLGEWMNGCGCGCGWACVQSCICVSVCVCVCVRGHRGCCLCGHGWMVCACVGDKCMHWWYLGCGFLGVCGCGWLDGRVDKPVWVWVWVCLCACVRACLFGCLAPGHEDMCVVLVCCCRVAVLWA